MATDARQPVLSREKTIRTALIIGAVLCSLIVPHTLVAEEEQPELDNQKNIGFMQNVPEELRRELPMCDEFLDVKWIKEMPTHKNWVGRVVVDIWTGERKEQRELAVVESSFFSKRRGRFKIVDLTATKYRGSQFDKLIRSADHATNLVPLEEGSDVITWGLAVTVNGERIVITKDSTGAQKYLDKGLTSGLMSSLTRGLTAKICIVHPDKKRWVFKKK